MSGHVASETHASPSLMIRWFVPAGHAVYSEFLIFCEIEGFDYFSIDGNFNDLRRAFMHQFCPEKKKNGCRKYYGDQDHILFF